MPSSLPPTHQGYGVDMLRTLLSSKRQNRATNSYNISTPSTLTYTPLQRTPTQMVLYPFWTLKLHLDETPDYSQKSKENLSTENRTFIWTATTTFLLKFSMINILSHRARTVCVNQQLLHQYKFPSWALTRLKITSNHKYNTTQTSNNKNTHMVVPYTKVLSDSFKNTSSKMRISVYFKGLNTIKDLVVTMDKDTITQKSGVIYRYTRDRLECDEEYKGESARTLGGQTKGTFFHCE